MSFTKFKKLYKEKLDSGVYFETVDESAELIASLYDADIKVGSSLAGGILRNGNKSGLENGLKTAFQSGKMAVFLTQLDLGLIAYWTGVGPLTNTSTVVTPGGPSAYLPLPVPSSVDEFLDRLTTSFSTHLKTVGGRLGSSLWAGYTVP